MYPLPFVYPVQQAPGLEGQQPMYMPQVPVQYFPAPVMVSPQQNALPAGQSEQKHEPNAQEQAQTQPSNVGSIN